MLGLLRSADVLQVRAQALWINATVPTPPSAQIDTIARLPGPTAASHLPPQEVGARRILRLAAEVRIVRDPDRRGAVREGRGVAGGNGARAALAVERGLEARELFHGAVGARQAVPRHAAQGDHQV